MRHLSGAADCGRVLVERAELLAPHAHPLDFASGSGLAMHAALGFLAWGHWSACCACAGAAVDHYAEWRWSVHAVRHTPHTHRATRLQKVARWMLRVGDRVWDILVP